MNVSHIEHIGIAVKSLDEAIPFWEKQLGLKCYSIEEVKEQKVRTAFFKIGQSKIELLESTDPEGPIGKFIEKKGGGIQHLAFAVEGLQERLTELAGNGVQLIDKSPRKGAEGLDIAFLHPKSTHGILLELCEDPRTVSYTHLDVYKRQAAWDAFSPRHACRSAALSEQGSRIARL